MLQRAANEPPLLNMASSMAPESRKLTPLEKPTHISKSVDSWHNWHMIEAASWTEVTAVVQPTTPHVSLSISGGSNPHHTDLTLLTD